MRRERAKPASDGRIAEEICHLVSGRTMRHVLRGFDRPVEQMFLDHLKEQ